MIKKGSEIADEIIQEWAREAYFKKLVERKKKIMEMKNGGNDGKIKN